MGCPALRWREEKIDRKKDKMDLIAKNEGVLFFSIEGWTEERTVKSS